MALEQISFDLEHLKLFVLTQTFLLGLKSLRRISGSSPGKLLWSVLEELVCETFLLMEYSSLMNDLVRNQPTSPPGDLSHLHHVCFVFVLHHSGLVCGVRLLKCVFLL